MVESTEVYGWITEEPIWTLCENELQAAEVYVTGMDKWHRLNMSLVDDNPKLKNLSESICQLEEQAYYMGIIQGIDKKNNDKEHNIEALQLPEKSLQPVLKLLEEHGQPDDKEYLCINLEKFHTAGFKIGWYNLYGDTSEEDLPNLYKQLSKLE